MFLLIFSKIYYNYVMKIKEGEIKMAKATPNKPEEIGTVGVTGTTEPKPEENKPKSEEGNKEEVPTWGQKLQEQMTKLMEKMEETPTQKATEIPVPPPPKPKEPEIQTEPLNEPQQQTEEKPKKRNLLNWLF